MRRAKADGLHTAFWRATSDLIARLGPTLVCTTLSTTVTATALAQHQAGTPLAVQWQAPTECGDETALRTKIAALVDGDPMLERPLSADVRVSHGDAGYTLRLRLTDDSATSERLWTGPSCDEVAGAAAVAVALAVQSRRLENTTSTTESSAPTQSEPTAGSPPSNQTTTPEMSAGKSTPSTQALASRNTPRQRPRPPRDSADRDDSSDEVGVVASLTLANVGADFAEPLRLGAGLGLGVKFGAWVLQLGAVLDLPRELSSSDFVQTHVELQSAHATLEFCRYIGESSVKWAPCIRVSGETLGAEGGGAHVVGFQAPRAASPPPTLDNDSDAAVSATIATEFYELDANGVLIGEPVASQAAQQLEVAAKASATAKTSASISTPKRWGPPPTQQPNLYAAVTFISLDGEVIDVYRTDFGIRTLELSPDQGLIVNGERIKIEGVCNHHDLGALGAAAYPRGKERQLEILAAMGANAVRTSHNPEAPVLYDLADRLGFLIMDEAFDVWSNGKTELDHHLFFDDWSNKTCAP